MLSYAGYHGTSPRFAKIIIKDNYRKSSKVGWLGTGVYFYDSDYEMAYRFATRKFSSSDTVVLKSDISLPQKEVLDLCDPKSEHSKEFHAMRLELIPQLKAQNVSLRIPSKKSFDGAVINIICDRKRYTLVRCHTVSHTNIDTREDTFSRIINGTEICLRNIEYILGTTPVTE